MGQACEMMQLPSKVRLGSQLLIKARPKQHHSISILPWCSKSKQQRDPMELGMGEAARARDDERHVQAQGRRWAAAFAQLLSWLFTTPKPC